MGRFLNELVLAPTGKQECGRAIYKLYADFSYEYGNYLSGGRILVPKGFLTDLSSVPRLLWWLVPATTGQHAAVLHDFLYVTHWENRALADAIFRSALADAGVGPIIRWWMWAAVRIFGGKHFKTYKGDHSCDSS